MALFGSTTIIISIVNYVQCRDLWNQI